MDQDAELLIGTVGEAARLLASDGAMIYLVDEASGELRFAHDAGVADPEARRLLPGLRLPAGFGLFGTALARGELVSTDDYPADQRFRHHEVADRVVARVNMRSVAAAPMFANDRPLGVLGVFSSRPAAFDHRQLALLRSLAEHAAAAIANRRLLAQLRESEERLRLQATELERSLAAQRALGEISRQIVDVADSAAVMQQVVDVASRLLNSDGAHLTMMNDEGTDLIPMVMAGTTEPSVRAWLHSQRFPVGGGINGLAAQTRQVVWTEDYARDPRLPHDPADDSATRLELGAVAAAPLGGPGGEVIGTLAITYRRPRTIDPRDMALLAELAGQAAIAARNARLYADLRDRTDALARVVEAQRTLSEIAVQITSIRDPAVVLQRTVDEAVRLLSGDLALIHPLGEEDGRLERALAFAPPDQPPDDLGSAPGEGISGLAIAERRVVYTGDYLSEPAIQHAPSLDAYITQRGFRSAISAPLVGGAGPIGTLSVLARRADAFTETDARLLGALGAQAAIAISNARLYGQLEQSERRYRHLVDHAPDLVWAVDAEGRLSYLGETLERMTGFTSEGVLGEPWTSLLTADSVAAAERGWRAIQERPDEEQQLRVQARLAAGGAMAAEINMIGTTVDGRFAGAHGSLRDITERERLEDDLRRRSAELAANEERSNLARELHDSVTQALFSMGLTLRTVELLLDRDPVAARAKLGELRDLQNDALAEMRTLIFELRPRGLETDGLAQALRNHAAAVQGRTGLAVTVEVRIDDRLPLDTEEALYRISQEALHNVVKHANARSARIRLRRSGQDVQLTVEDDGSGFEPAAVSGARMGLSGMRQRAERVGGRLTVGPGLRGEGTRVTVRLPLETDGPTDGQASPPAAASQAQVGRMT